tara:strand:- start:1776 stop:2408 length:633 start_codon:yes stop_codon:yes gene_type:complete
MTFSILARNPKTGEIGGAATTGNLCVGGWVLRGDIKKGVTASQGFYPSTLWGENILKNLNKFSPITAINKVIKNDKNKHFRQVACLNLSGNGFSFTGKKNINYYNHVVLPNLVVSGNMLTNDKVIDKIAQNFKLKNEPLANTLLEALKIGKKFGSDKRGLMSAALLVFKKNNPPLNIRVDYDINPLLKLEKILKMTNKKKYKVWLKKLPT